MNHPHFLKTHGDQVIMSTFSHHSAYKSEAYFSVGDTYFALLQEVFNWVSKSVGSFPSFFIL